MSTEQESVDLYEVVRGGGGGGGRCVCGKQCTDLYLMYVSKGRERNR